MAGGSEPHSLIAANVIRELGSRLRGRGCRVYTGDMRVKVVATGLSTYPDVSVVCGPPELAGNQRRTLLNPLLIVEVLSSSTEAYDRGDKFAHYQRMDSLREYLLISQDRPRVERYLRQAESDEWVLTTAHGLETRIHLPSVGCDLTLADVYEHVAFPSQPPPLHPPGYAP
jgi:Uma2 family endonuclease